MNRTHSEQQQQQQLPIPFPTLPTASADHILDIFPTSLTPSLTTTSPETRLRPVDAEADEGEDDEEDDDDHGNDDIALHCRVCVFGGRVCGGGGAGVSQRSGACCVV